MQITRRFNVFVSLLTELISKCHQYFPYEIRVPVKTVVGASHKLCSFIYNYISKYYYSVKVDSSNSC